MKLYAGLDLHARNTYIGIMNTAFNRVFKKRVSNQLELILHTLEPFRDRIKGFVAESTYNWCRLVDGLMDAFFYLLSRFTKLFGFQLCNDNFGLRQYP